MNIFNMTRKIDGVKVLINFDHVVVLHPTEASTFLEFERLGSIEVKESLQEILDIINCPPTKMLGPF